MASKRQIQIAEIMQHRAADYFARESNRESLITVTRADVSPDLKNVKVYLSVMPEKFETAALNFAKRNRTDFRNFLKKAASLARLPIVDFVIDDGEKNRQRIDELTRN